MGKQYLPPVPSARGSGSGARRVAIRVAVVHGPSMVPTLRSGDAILIRIGARIRPGDVVVARFAGQPTLVVKRAVRPVGDRWWVEGDNTFVADDSRRYGPALVCGRVVLRWWPRPWRIRRGPR